jgi:hypothetical protein
MEVSFNVQIVKNSKILFVPRKIKLNIWTTLNSNSLFRKLVERIHIYE